MARQKILLYLCKVCLQTRTSTGQTNSSDTQSFSHSAHCSISSFHLQAVHSKWYKRKVAVEMISSTYLSHIPHTVSSQTFGFIPKRVFHSQCRCAWIILCRRSLTSLNSKQDFPLCWTCFFGSVPRSAQIRTRTSASATASQEQALISPRVGSTT